MVALGGCLGLFVLAFAGAAIAYYGSLGVCLLVLGALKFIFTGRV